MTFWRALNHFTREAGRNLLRSWKVSLVAVLMITVSLFLSGVFWLVRDNLRQGIDEWRRDSRLVVYFAPDAGIETIEGSRRFVSQRPFVATVEVVDQKKAEERFKRSFPSLEDLLVGWSEEPLPASLEIEIDWSRATPTELDALTAALRAEAAVAMVDDDRDWLAQIESLVAIFEGAALFLGIILLITAIFTISSVIRLTAYLYHDEIAVMRLVGATEFFIRGPFYLEGFFQGLLGGTLATLLLFAGHAAFLEQASSSLLGTLVAGHFLSWSQLASLVMLGGAAGLIGAIASLRRETLGQIVDSSADLKT
jgi:cell division transport system permease protein